MSRPPSTPPTNKECSGSLKKLEKSRLWLDVEYSPEHTDPEGLAEALNRLLETALSTPGIMEDYGEPHFGLCCVAAVDPSSRSKKTIRRKSHVTFDPAKRIVP